MRRIYGYKSRWRGEGTGDAPDVGDSRSRWITAIGVVVALAIFALLLVMAVWGMEWIRRGS